MAKKEKTTVVKSGIGFSGLLTLLFIALKLTGHITWAWIWVLSPIWMSVALVIFLIMMFLLVALILR